MNCGGKIMQPYDTCNNGVIEKRYKFILRNEHLEKFEFYDYRTATAAFYKMVSQRCRKDARITDYHDQVTNERPKAWVYSAFINFDIRFDSIDLYAVEK